MARRIELPDGSRWPRPSMEKDDELGVAWKLIHAPDRMTRADQHEAASIIGAYGYLIIDSTQARRNAICSGIRKSIESEPTA